MDKEAENLYISVPLLNLIWCFTRCPVDLETSGGIRGPPWQSFFNVFFLVESETHRRRLQWRNCIDSLKTGRRIKLNLNGCIFSPVLMVLLLSAILTAASLFSTLCWCEISASLGGILPFSIPSSSSSSTLLLPSLSSSSSSLGFAPRIREESEEQPSLMTDQKGDFLGSDRGETTHDFTSTTSVRGPSAEICNHERIKSRTQGT